METLLAATRVIWGGIVEPHSKLHIGFLEPSARRGVSDVHS
jgi:hypothetical protein